MNTTPRVDTFQATDSAGNPVRFTVSSEIIDYIEPARAFGKADLADSDAHGSYQRRMIAIPDRRPSVTSPMVLTIGNDNGLFLVRTREGADTGAWDLIELGTAFKGLSGDKPQVRALGANWTDDDRIAVAVAVDNGTADARSRIFIAYNLSSKDTDWSKIEWTDCGYRENVRVEAIRVLDEGDRTWHFLFTGSLGPERHGLRVQK